MFGGLLLVLLITVVGLWRSDIKLQVLTERWGGNPSRFVDVDAIRVHYRDEGLEAAPVPVVLLHGTSASLFTWQAWVDLLKGSQRLLRLDLPGAGLSELDPTGDYGATRQADVVLQFMDKLEIQQAVVVGAGSGGRVAIEIAATAPRRVDRLVLIASTGYPNVSVWPPSARDLAFRINRALRRILPRAALQRMLPARHAEPPPVAEESTDRDISMMFREGISEVLAAAAREDAEGFKSSIVQTIQAKTLILWGSADKIIPSAHAQRFLAEISDSRLRIIPAVGHLPHEESPEKSVSRFLRFLEE